MAQVSAREKEISEKGISEKRKVKSEKMKVKSKKKTPPQLVILRACTEPVEVHSKDLPKTQSPNGENEKS